MSIETLEPRKNSPKSKWLRVKHMETVKRLTREVRIPAKYHRSLEVLHYLEKSSSYKAKKHLT